MCSAVLSLEEKAEMAPEKSLKVTAAFGAESPTGDVRVPAHNSPGDWDASKHQERNPAWQAQSPQSWKFP